MAVVFDNKMIFVVALFVVLCAFQGLSRSIHEPSMEERHTTWMVQFGKVYKDNAEKEKRFQIFKENVDYIESSNKAGNKPYKQGINQFTDLTKEEFRATYNGYKTSTRMSSSAIKPFKYENVTAVPPSLDWRTKGVITAIKDQGQCGKSHSLTTRIIYSTV